MKIYIFQLPRLAGISPNKPVTGKIQVIKIHEVTDL